MKVSPDLIHDTGKNTEKHIQRQSEWRWSLFKENPRFKHTFRKWRQSSLPALDTLQNKRWLLSVNPFSGRILSVALSSHLLTDTSRSKHTPCRLCQAEQSVSLDDWNCKCAGILSGLPWLFNPRAAGRNLSKERKLFPVAINEGEGPSASDPSFTTCWMSAMWCLLWFNPDNHFMGKYYHILSSRWGDPAVSCDLPHATWLKLLRLAFKGNPTHLDSSLLRAASWVSQNLQGYLKIPLSCETAFRGSPMD